MLCYSILVSSHYISNTALTNLVEPDWGKNCPEDLNTITEELRAVSSACALVQKDWS